MITLFLLFYTFLLPVEPTHDFHNSLAEMNYNAQSQAFEVSLRVFTDDFENALKKEFQLNKFKISKTEKQADYILPYVQKNFILKNDKKEASKITYIGKEIDGKLLWLYFEIPFKDKIEGATLQYSVLFELFNDQSNLANIAYKDQKQTLFYSPKESTQKLSFK